MSVFRQTMKNFAGIIGIVWGCLTIGSPLMLGGNNPAWLNWLIGCNIAIGFLAISYLNAREQHVAARCKAETVGLDRGIPTDHSGPHS